MLNIYYQSLLRQIGLLKIIKKHCHYYWYKVIRQSLPKRKISSGLFCFSSPSVVGHLTLDLKKWAGSLEDALSFHGQKRSFLKFAPFRLVAYFVFAFFVLASPVQTRDWQCYTRLDSNHKLKANFSLHANQTMNKIDQITKVFYIWTHFVN